MKTINELVMRISLDHKISPKLARTIAQDIAKSIFVEPTLLANMINNGERQLDKKKK